MQHTRKGAIAELIFSAVALDKGLNVYKPVVDDKGCDFIVCNDSRLFKVQVKSTYSQDKRHSFTNQKEQYKVTNRRSYKGHTKYEIGDYDALVIYIVPRQIFYIIPFEKCFHIGCVRLTPENPRNKYYKFKENWDFFKT